MTSNGEQYADQVIARLRSEPDHEWHIARNVDGGAAAEDFIRNAKARNARSEAEKAESRRAAALDVFARVEASNPEFKPF